MTSETNLYRGLSAIGWRGDVALPADRSADWRVARVIAQHRHGYVLNDGHLHDGRDEFAAQPAPRFIRRGAVPSERPAVGDFVLIDAAKPIIIHEVLPRRTTLSRAAAGERYERQIIAANIDYVFVLMGLDGDFNPRRIERYLLLIQGSGAQPVIVLTKLDKVEEATMYTSA